MCIVETASVLHLFRIANFTAFLFSFLYIEKKETLKPRITDFSPRNLTVTVGSRVHLQCNVESQFKDTAPYIKLVKYLRIFKGNETNSTIFLNAKDSTVHRDAYKKVDRFYEVTEKGDYFDVVETRKIERAFSSELVLSPVELNDDATYTCITFNDVGYSKESMYLHVIPGVYSNILKQLIHKLSSV